MNINIIEVKQNKILVLLINKNKNDIPIKIQYFVIISFCFLHKIISHINKTENINIFSYSLYIFLYSMMHTKLVTKYTFM